MSTRTLFRSLLGVFTLLVLTTHLAFAWPDQPPDFATISGPGLIGSVKITDPDQLAALKLGAVEDFELGVLFTPPHVEGAGYQITRYFYNGTFNFASLHYYPDPAGGPGYLYFEDGPDLRGNHTPYHDHWLGATPQGAVALKQLLAHIGAQNGTPIESSAPLHVTANIPLSSRCWWF
jgi:hypothetical protein